MDQELTGILRNLGQALNKHDVEYLLVGGVAISFYGTPRTSRNLPKDIEYDIDIWYSATLENFSQLAKAPSSMSPELTDDLDRIIFDPKKSFV